MKGRVASIVLLCLITPLLLAVGRVETRDGKTIDGAIAVVENAFLVRSAGGEVRVPVESVSRAWMDYTPVPTLLLARDGPLPVVPLEVPVPVPEPMEPEPVPVPVEPVPVPLPSESPPG